MKVKVLIFVFSISLNLLSQNINNHIIIPIGQNFTKELVNKNYFDSNCNTNKLNFNKKNGIKFKLDKIEYYKFDSLQVQHHFKSHSFDYDRIGREISDIESISTQTGWRSLNSKTTREYDNNGNLIRITNYKFSGISLMRDTKQEYSYDSFGNIIKDEIFIWSGSWKKDQKKIFRYNSKHQELLKEKYVWDNVNYIWVGDTLHGYFPHYLDTYPKQEHTYFSDGMVETYKATNWDFQNNEWVYYYKSYTQVHSTNTYKEKGYYFYDNQWIENENYFIYTFSILNSIRYISSMNSYYTKDNSQWWKGGIIIDTLGNLLDMKAEMLINSNWITEYEIVREYNDKFDIISDNFYLNSSRLSVEAWGYGSYNKSYFYNSETDLTSYAFKEWDTTNLTWLETISNNYTYNSNDTIPDILLSSEFHKITSNFNIVTWVYQPLNLLRHKILTSDTYENNHITGRRDLKERIKFYYSNETKLSNENEISFSNLKIFPNPVKDYLKITFPDKGRYAISIYDILGKQVLSKQVILWQSRIDVSMLSKGVYLLNVKGMDNNKAITLKIIKR